jgi:hypothetical protein
MKRLALFAVALTLLAASPAFAQDAVGDAYGGKGGGVLGAVSDGGNSGGGGSSPANNSTPAAPAPSQVQAAPSSEATLPFTGLDLGLLAVGGVLLVGVGVGLRRFARPLS